MYKLTLEQQEAKEILLTRTIEEEQPISILTGQAGTGKSVLMSSLEEDLSAIGHKIKYVTFTGSASQQLTNKGKDACTIHSLIYTPIIKRGIVVGFQKKPKAEVRQQASIFGVDEISMVSNELMTDLESYGIQIIASGDYFQLPPIGERNKYYGSTNFELKQVQRQALESPLLWAATEVRKGNNVLYGNYKNKLLVDAKHTLDEKWLRKDVVFIVGTNNTKNKINEHINNGAKPKIGSKIMFLKNDFGNDIVNGTEVEILDISKVAYTTYLTFRHNGILYDKYKADYREQLMKNNQFFDLSYAKTAHKAQGQTIENPIVIVDESYIARHESKNWQYVALTRGTGNNPVAWLR